ncbi:putative mitochondrial protein [Cucumis melo var. makuwa]|uniref:Mitochondrial protein n=1 Tax=Cucumis melo var. makuwa TaxID=1194695 RepID=A0A5D3CIF2_CUCMM|nr:putative mitochondrial protein [Cucumis melo var. makuwa]TYK11611.1 putative mitochondrial protein [Cucumis melo var. makuwa]
MALAHNWQIRQLDINNAFLHGILTKEVYMEQPVGFTIESNLPKPLVCKLKKALYGLKQSPGAWFDRLKTFLLSQDDIIVTGSSRHDIDKLISQMNATFSLKDLRKLSYFLGIESKTIVLASSNKNPSISERNIETWAATKETYQLYSLGRLCWCRLGIEP